MAYFPGTVQKITTNCTGQMTKLLDFIGKEGIQAYLSADCTDVRRFFLEEFQLE
jgi:hypothetical protein